MLFVRKKNGELRLCVDWRRLNAVTKKNATIIPRVDDLLDEIGPSARYFSVIDLRSAYHQIRLRPEDTEKTAFRTPYGHFEFTVVSFGLCNAPATFQSLMFRVLRPMLGRFVACYLDDILIYSETQEEHVSHLRQVLEALRRHQLYANRDKSNFGLEKVHYLGHVLRAGGLVEPDPTIVRSVREWPVLSSRKQVRAFLGLAGWHRRFIKGFSRVARPLTELTKDSVKFQWDPEAQGAFDKLKHLLTTAPVLRVFDPGRRTRVVSDASKFAVGASLLQQDEETQLWHPVAFYSRKLKPAERNYPVHEQELLALIAALKAWRHYLHGARIKISLHTDHRTLTFLGQQAHLSAQQARWVEFLAEFDAEIEYVAGTTNLVADALSRRPDMESAAEDEPSTLALLESSVSNSSWERRVRALLPKDAYAERMRKILRASPATRRERTFEEKDGLLYFDSRLYIPDLQGMRQTILHELHEAAGHFGPMKIYAAARRLVFWPRMDEDIRNWTASCASCLRHNTNRGRQGGQLQPLEVPTRPWAAISRDFITGLPRTARGVDAIAVDVCRLSKMVILTPCRADDTAERAASRFLDSVVCQFGVPSSIVSDRDPKFTGRFWQELFRLLGTKLKMSSADHPQTDGQTEIYNRVVEEVLRHMVRTDQADWDLHLKLAQFALNSSVSSTTRQTPFETLYGFAPHTPLSLTLPQPTRLSAVPAAASFCNKAALRWRLVRDRVALAQLRQTEAANAGRSLVEYAVGDKVLVSTKALTPVASRIDGTTRKLGERYSGPFVIRARVGLVAYKLQLPECYRAHPVFHVSRLRLFSGARVLPASRQSARLAATRPTPKVSAILGRRTQRGRLQYLVRWHGVPACEATWIYKTKLNNCAALVAAYDQESEARMRQNRRTSRADPEGSGRGGPTSSEEC